MRIEIYKGWIIRSDDRNIVLCKSTGIKERKGKDGKMESYESFKDETYHATIKGAMETLCEKEIYACKAATFKELQDEYRKLDKMIEKFSKQLKEE